MRFSLLLLFTFVFMVRLPAQKVIYDSNIEVRAAAPFHAIAVSAGIDLYLSHGEEKVGVSAKSLELRSHIRTRVDNGVLKIWYEWKEGRQMSFGSNKALKAYVSYTALDGLHGSGGSDITVDGVLRAAVLQLHISGGSDFKGGVDIQNLKIHASGGSDVLIEGRVGTLSMDVSGGSDVDGFALTSEKATISASGGSDVQISVTRDINANASGGSDVRYKGPASVTDIRSSGSSRVKKVTL
ncbi:MAG: head GIN domain-containing protein [Chitinophagaceae bacterium]